MSYGKGSYVIWTPTGQVGRVRKKSTIHENAYYVCWYESDTASTAPASLIRPATPEEIASAPAGLGGGLFEEKR
jgi:hypothetical protein